MVKQIFRKWKLFFDRVSLRREKIGGAGQGWKLAREDWEDLGKGEKRCQYEGGGSIKWEKREER